MALLSAKIIATIDLYSLILIMLIKLLIKLIMLLNTMKITKNSLPKNQLEITVELSNEEMKPYLENAAKEVSKSKNIPGFRPGLAPYDVVVRTVGEMSLYQTAANDAIAATYYDAVEKENLEPVEQPEIKITKLAPGNPFVYTATIALLPGVTICEYSKIKVKPTEESTVEPKEIEKVLADLQRIRQKEVLTDKKAEKGDKVEVDFETLVDNVAIEGGQAKKHSILIGEGNMIPGFEDNLIGLKKDEEKSFELTFPKEYHAKELAGKKANFKVKILGVYKIELPELNDEFASGLGLKTLDSLKKNIGDNLKHEKELKAKQAHELEIMEKLNEKCEFGELPDVLINREAHKMVHELEDNLTRQGLNFDDYLKHLKKTESELMLDFTPDAIKRVKSALVIRQIAKQENISVDDKDVEDEVERTLAGYKMHPSYAEQINDLEKNLRSEEAKHYFKNLLTNRKTMEFLKKITGNS